jgi:hypothetical protein
LLVGTGNMIFANNAVYCPAVRRSMPELTDADEFHIRQLLVGMTTHVSEARPWRAIR